MVRPGLWVNKGANTYMEYKKKNLIWRDHMKRRFMAASKTYFCLPLMYFILKSVFLTLNVWSSKNIFLLDQIIKLSIVFVTYFSIFFFYSLPRGSCLATIGGLFKFHIPIDSLAPPLPYVSFILRA